MAEHLPAGSPIGQGGYEPATQETCKFSDPSIDRVPVGITLIVEELSQRRTGVVLVMGKGGVGWTDPTLRSWARTEQHLFEEITGHQAKKAVRVP